jgi:hypothetical protein
VKDIGGSSATVPPGKVCDDWLQPNDGCLASNKDNPLLSGWKRQNVMYCITSLKSVNLQYNIPPLKNVSFCSLQHNPMWITHLFSSLIWFLHKHNFHIIMNVQLGATHTYVRNILTTYNWYQNKLSVKHYVKIVI